MILKILLDIAHARVATSNRRVMVENYLEKLPLEAIKQIQISGASIKDGYFQDTHDVMQDEDYAMLQWILEKCKPMVVTLEYFRELAPLREQLWRL